MADIDRHAWNALALPLHTPFLEWDWLRSLEGSGSMTPETGWLPCHLTVRENGRLVGAAPLYVKTHSEGEFVFDQAWAEVAGKMGIRYYPKLVGMSPATPVPGYRFLIAPDMDETALTAVMIEAIDRFCSTNRLSGCSFLFADPEWQSLVTRLGFTRWIHQGFVWRNPGYRNFEEYLDRFNTNQRRNIRRERRTVDNLGLVMRTYADRDVPETLVRRMYRFYSLTNDKFGIWGCRYLTDTFFSMLARQYRHRVVLIAAYRPGNNEEPLGMSLLIRKNDALFGRYWGCLESIGHLHFNVCYYAPIQWAIGNGIARFDPGLGGPHKLRRGFEAVANASLHRFFDPVMRRFMDNHIGEINRLETEHIDELNRRIPFASSRAI